MAVAVYLGSKLQLHFKFEEPDFGLAEVTPGTGVASAPGTVLDVHWPVADTMVYRAPAASAQ